MLEIGASIKKITNNKTASNNITKSIKKLCQEAKISPQMREKIFLICDERGIIYVEGLGVASRVAADETTTRYLMIKKERTGHEK